MAHPWECTLSTKFESKSEKEAYLLLVITYISNSWQKEPGWTNSLVLLLDCCFEILPLFFFFFCILGWARSWKWWGKKMCPCLSLPEGWVKGNTWCEPLTVLLKNLGVSVEMWSWEHDSVRPELMFMNCHFCFLLLISGENNWDKTSLGWMCSLQRFIVFSGQSWRRRSDFWVVQHPRFTQE